MKRSSTFSIIAVLLVVGMESVATAWRASVSSFIRPSATTGLRVEYITSMTSLPKRENPAYIFFDNFDRPPSPESYFDLDAVNGGFRQRDGEGYGNHGGAMKCQFEKGQVAAGALKVLFGKNPFQRGIRNTETFREIYWRVYVKHEAGWQGNPAKLGRATCMAASDWSQGFIAHVWGGKGDALCIDPATGIRDSRKVSERYNDFAHLRWLGLRDGRTPLFSPAEAGRWVCIESHVRLNTPGKSDGVFELWVDGKPEAARNDLDWHGVWNDYAINAVFLENYWNDGSVKRQARWFDDLVISTKPIGPVVLKGNPAVTRTAGAVTVWEAQVAADPEGRDIVWTSRPANGTATTLTLGAIQGAFSGSCAAQKRFANGGTYWVRLRERKGANAWSEWTSWHAPFRLSEDPS